MNVSSDRVIARAGSYTGSCIAIDPAAAGNPSFRHHERRNQGPAAYMPVTMRVRLAAGLVLATAAPCHAIDDGAADIPPRGWSRHARARSAAAEDDSIVLESFCSSKLNLALSMLLNSHQFILQSLCILALCFHAVPTAQGCSAHPRKHRVYAFTLVCLLRLFCAVLCVCTSAAAMKRSRGHFDSNAFINTIL